MKAFVAKLVALGPLGLFVLALLDSTGVPIVGGVDTVLVILANQSPGMAYWCALMATVGSLIGCFVLFSLARKGGEKYLANATAGPRGQQFRRWFDRYGLVTIFVPAVSPIPLPLKAFVACAAVLGTSPTRFLLTILIARVPRYLFLAWLGQEMGSDALGWIKAHSLQFALGLVGLAVVLFLIFRLANAGAASEDSAQSGLQSVPPLPPVAGSDR